MGGVDLLDGLLSYYRIPVKSKKWYRSGLLSRFQIDPSAPMAMSIGLNIVIQRVVAETLAAKEYQKSNAPNVR